MSTKPTFTPVGSVVRPTNVGKYVTGMLIYSAKQKPSKLHAFYKRKMPLLSGDEWFYQMQVQIGNATYTAVQQMTSGFVKEHELIAGDRAEFWVHSIPLPAAGPSTSGQSGRWNLGREHAVMTRVSCYSVNESIPRSWRLTAIFSSSSVGKITLTTILKKGSRAFSSLRLL